MAGSQAIRTRRGGHVVGLAVMFLALGATARAQGPGVPSPAPPGDFASIVDATEPTTGLLFPEPLLPAPSFGGGGGPVPIVPRIEMGLFDTAIDSLFGDVYAEGRWRPLSLSTFFSEGWLEPWAGAPAGRDGLPRGMATIRDKLGHCLHDPFLLPVRPGALPTQQHRPRFSNGRSVCLPPKIANSHHGGPGSLPYESTHPIATVRERWQTRAKLPPLQRCCPVPTPDLAPHRLMALRLMCDPRPSRVRPRG
jgi:hypothetical protein